ncbi:protease [Mucilaginibacter phyllosphaerae]
MKNYQILAIALLALSSCGTRTGNNQQAAQPADSAATTTGTAPAEKKLTADMMMKDTIKAGDSVLLTFTVKNNTADSLSFCKWHTPFEPPMSKYLDVKDETGTDADYKGPMAKRIMPPPASSYIKVAGNDSLSVKADLLKSYNITKPGKYTVSYNSQEISGLVVSKSLTFVYLK